jgi:hypothetical protein
MGLVTDYECPRCWGTGSLESSDSTDDGWWACSTCKGKGRLAERRRPNPMLTKVSIGRAANAMAGWFLENVHGETHQELCELHPDAWKEAAEVAIRAARGEFDCRPFTTSPHRLAPNEAKPDA